MVTLADLVKPEVIAEVLKRIPKVTFTNLDRRFIDMWRYYQNQTLLCLVKPDIVITHKEPS